MSRPHPAPTALVAEDEPLLAMNLVAELKAAWPELRIVKSVGDGNAAVAEAIADRPDVLFLDIRMPGMTGIEAAQALAEDWPYDAPLPLLVFVTAYEQYAVEAFESSAIDYVLKPVQPARIAETCERLRAALKLRRAADGTSRDHSMDKRQQPDAMLEKLVQLLASGAAGPPPAIGAWTPGGPATSGEPGIGRLDVIQAAVGNAVHVVPVSDVDYFEAADKYVRVVTAEREYLIRTPLKELIPRLDPDRFWQIHRGTLVRNDAISAAVRDESGKLALTLKGHRERLAVSRLYAGRFRPM